MLKKEFINNICPKCGNKILIKKNDCKNKHIINNIFLNEYEKIQHNDLSKKKFGGSESQNLLFNKSESNKCDNSQINYHPYNSYYNECKLNICQSCFKNHEKHEIMPYNDAKIETNRLKEEMPILKGMIK